MKETYISIGEYCQFQFSVQSKREEGRLTNLRLRPLRFETRYNVGEQRYLLLSGNQRPHMTTIDDQRSRNKR